ncbi:helix-turn-helix transcriptional regulator [Pseudomonas aeruginosa]|nr:helix-turn-helix transcriptional regulator [Pseudomonas aeruginosa]EMC8549338.1 helix-turn-helix transcriptional regulator [Pseudomonas aeruginosa]EMC8583466.1 helix-turn-helix transcriptional regulator [Pseudomonas aeruginosa]
MPSLREIIGARIKSLRKASNLSQSELAELIGCDAPLVSRYERGINLPGIEQLIRISTIFNVSPGDLLPSKDDELREKLTALRREISERVLQIDTPGDLEEIISHIDRLAPGPIKNKPQKSDH